MSPDSRLRVLTHNVYWFQGWPSRWGAERVAEAPGVFDALMRLYMSVAPDVICLQEVHRSDLAQAASGELGMATWVHAAGGRRHEYGGAILSQWEAGLRDCTCAGPAHERIHLRASVVWEGGRLDLAAVHLPSNRYAGSLEAGEAERVAELRRVLETHPPPNVVAGDMNCLVDSAPYRLMVEAGYTDAAVASGTATSSGRRVDYLWLDAEWASRLTRFAVLEDEMLVRDSPGASPWRLSDHPPLLMELQ